MGGLAEEDVMLVYLVSGTLVLITLFVLSGVRIIRPTGRGLVERLGKYHRFAMPGFSWIVPMVDRMFLVNITEVMVNAEPQEIITNAVRHAGAASTLA